MGGTVTRDGAGKRAPAALVLVVVESPAKARTIERLLGPGYRAIATTGHLVDLPRSRLGVDVGNGFEPEYITVRGKAPILRELRKAAAGASSVLLATDPDREGEAIAWNIGRLLAEKYPELVVSRIVFDELAASAAREAVASPRPPDLRAVEAQKARRVLDRLVGYGLSPLLWKKVKSGLSAGRAQSAALHLLCGREREIDAWVPGEAWELLAGLGKGRSAFSAGLVLPDGSPRTFRSEAEASAFARSLRGRSVAVTALRETETVIAPEPPFTTPSFIQAASSRLGFQPKRAMRAAQELYEGVLVDGVPTGLLTFPRTGSESLRPSAVEEARAWIAASHPAELPEPGFVSPRPESPASAREALRPVSVNFLPGTHQDALTDDQAKVYALVWERFVASQMSSSKARGIEVELAEAGLGAVFRASRSRVVEPGFTRIHAAPGRAFREQRWLPALREGDLLPVSSVRVELRREQGPLRFTEASFVGALEKAGIGRPSTYAPIVSVLVERGYVAREKGDLVPTPLGLLVDELLSGQFPELVDPGFTAGLESALDRIETEGSDWRGLLASFYEPFRKRLDEAMEDLEPRRDALRAETELSCGLCGKPMVKRLGRNGYFLACSGFPACKSTRSIPFGPCPLCGKGEVVARRKTGGRGREFYGCTRYPECGFVSHRRPSGAACPKCGRLLVERWDRKLGTYKVCVNPDCGFLRDPVVANSHVVANSRVAAGGDDAAEGRAAGEDA